MSAPTRYHDHDVWRRGPRPMKRLTTPSVPLGQFVHLVGRAAYADDWADTSLPVRLPADRRIRNDADRRIQLVIDDISTALRDETIQASYQIGLPRPKIGSVITSKPTAEQDINSEQPVDLPEEDDEAPEELPWEPSTDKISIFDVPEEHVRGITYDITPSFWETDWQAALNWQTSSMPIPYGYIEARVLLHQAKQREIIIPLAIFRPDLKHGDNVLVGSIVTIEDGDVAIANMFKIDQLPDSRNIDRYLSFRNRLMDEVVAAAWRWLAINRSQSFKVENKELVHEIREYLSKQNIEPEIYKLSDSTIANLARQILNERESCISSDIVFKNSFIPMPPSKSLRHK